MGQGAPPLTAEADAFLDEVGGKGGDRPALAVRGEAHEVELGVDEVAQSDDLLGLLTSRLEAAATRSKQSERRILLESADSSALWLQAIETRKGVPTPFQFATFDAATGSTVDGLRRHRPASEALLRYQSEQRRVGESVSRTCR